MELGDELIAIYPKLNRFARSLAKDQHRAEDLVMEVITRLLERAEKLPLDINIESYAMRALKNYFIDEFRKDKFTQSDINSEGTSLFEETADETSEQLVGSSVAQTELIQVLDTLGENCREILTLFGLGYSYTEISEVAEIAMGTVMSRMARCRSTLVTLL
jgi:RNA polymerase sigma-70 factor, ECF subfamily